MFSDQTWCILFFLSLLPQIDDHTAGDNILWFFLSFQLISSFSVSLLVMDVDTSGREGNKRVYQRLGASNDRQQKVCFHWRAGKCNRFPCPFLHRELAPPTSSNGTASKRPHGFADDMGTTRRTPNFTPNSQSFSTWGRGNGAGAGNRVLKKTEKLCNYWVQGSCSFGDKCRYLHSWSLGEHFSLLTQLEGHQKVLIPITLSEFF